MRVFTFSVLSKRGGWADSREGVCVRVCWEGGEEVGSKVQDAAERASGNLARTCSSRFTCSR